MEQNKAIIRLIISSVIFIALITSCFGQNYETRGIVTNGSGILKNETYQSVIILGDPAATDDMIDEGGVSLTPGFLYVVEEPLVITTSPQHVTPPLLYPNPARNILHVAQDLLSSGEINVVIYTTEGKVMLNQQYTISTNNLLTIDVSQLEPSYYILSITTHGSSLSQQVPFVKN